VDIVRKGYNFRYKEVPEEAPFLENESNLISNVKKGEINKCRSRRKKIVYLLKQRVAMIVFFLFQQKENKKRKKKQ